MKVTALPSATPSKGKRSRYSTRWTTREGVKLRLEDMEEKHLVNCLAMMERQARKNYSEVSIAAWGCYSMMQGEMACMEMESSIAALEEEGWEALLPEVYHNMEMELARRHKANRVPS